MHRACVRMRSCVSVSRRGRQMAACSAIRSPSAAARNLPVLRCRAVPLPPTSTSEPAVLQALCMAEAGSPSQSTTSHIESRSATSSSSAVRKIRFSIWPRACLLQLVVHMQRLQHGSKIGFRDVASETQAFHRFAIAIVVTALAVNFAAAHALQQRLDGLCIRKQRTGECRVGAVHSKEACEPVEE